MIYTYPPDPCNFLLLSVLLWDPSVMYPQLFPGNGIKCPHSQCGKHAVTKFWNDGMLPSRQPRTIHGIGEAILLVSSVYVCDKNHKTLAHDPRVLAVLPTPSMVPFVLIHRTGFHYDFVNMVSSFCHNGMNFHSLEASIGQMRWENFLSRKSMYDNTVEAFQRSSQEKAVCPNFPSFEETGMSILPSNNLICNCFLAKFTEDEHYYIQCLQSADTGDSLSIDHTFKVASNIGYLRRDGKWVSQYDSVFFVINCEGKILSWKFTKGTSFQQVEGVLSSIRRRAHNQGNMIKLFYIDNCCQWKNKLQGLFGRELLVKLDLFHAIQRITKKISKRHQFYGNCVNDLCLVFREKNDQGAKRTKGTPKPTTLLHQLNKFVQKWGVVGDQEVLNVDAIAEIEKLKVHISKGCLSEIPVGGGTNRNEAFHRYINTFFHKSRIGTLYAYAILMLIIHKFNNSNCKKKNINKPVRALTLPSVTELEVMGIVPDDRLHPVTECVDTVNFDHIDPETMQHILNISISQFILSEAIQSQTCTANLPFKYIPYMQSLQCLALLPKKCNVNVVEGHKQRLHSILESWNFILEPVPADGNCFFTAVALNLLHDYEGNKKVLEEILEIEGHSVIMLVNNLRKALVQEWLGPNRGDYERVFGRKTFETEATKFLNDGFYDSVLGDAMPFSMANALKCNIVIFRSNENMPITYVSPREPSTKVVFVAYTDCGPGHYDSAVYRDASSQVELTIATEVVTRCRCGVNVKDQKRIACTGGSHSRCKCFAAQKQCTSLCDCKGCDNPFGTKVMLGKRKRERQAYSWQKFDLGNQSSLLDRGGKLEDGCWSLFESIVFVHVVYFIERNGILASVDRVEVIYNLIVSYSKDKDCLSNLPERGILRCKNIKQIASKLQHFNKECRLFKETIMTS